MHKTKERLL